MWGRSSRREIGISLAGNLVELTPLAICNPPAKKVAVMITTQIEKKIAIGGGRCVFGENGILFVEGLITCQRGCSLTRRFSTWFSFYCAWPRVLKLLRVGLAVVSLSGVTTFSVLADAVFNCNRDLPPGDYTLDSESGCYVSWDSSKRVKRTDFVGLDERGQLGGDYLSPDHGDCGMPSGFSKNVDEINSFFRKVSQVNHAPDSDCVVSYKKDATEDDVALRGVGIVYDNTGHCKNRDKNDPEKFLKCFATGFVFGNRSRFLTVEHAFENEEGNKTDPRYFSFYLKVWHPAKGAYDWVEYKIKKVVRKRFSGSVGHWDNLVEVELDRAVSEKVDGDPVPPQYWVEPFQLAEPMSDSEFFAQTPILAGFWADDDKYSLHRSCQGVKLSEFAEEDPFRKGKEGIRIASHNGNAGSGNSGGPLMILVGGKPKLVAVHWGSHKVWGLGVNNVAIDARPIRDLRDKDPRLATK